MSKVPERLKLGVSNIPAVHADEIPDEEWHWLKTQFPDDYKTAQGQIKAHAKALAAQEAEDSKTATAENEPADNASPTPKGESKKADGAGGKK